MQVGSIVELVGFFKDTATKSFLLAMGYVIPEKGKHYTVREIFYDNKNRPCILLEEIVNPKINTQWGLHEIGWNMYKFRELVPPINFEELLSQAKETVTHEEMVCV